MPNCHVIADNAIGDDSPGFNSHICPNSRWPLDDGRRVDLCTLSYLNHSRVREELLAFDEGTKQNTQHSIKPIHRSFKSPSLSNDAKGYIGYEQVHPVFNGKKGTQGYLVFQITRFIRHIGRDVVIADSTRHCVHDHRLNLVGKTCREIPQVGYINISCLTYTILQMQSMCNNGRIIEREGNLAGFFLMFCLCLGSLKERGQQVFIKKQIIAVDQKLLVDRELLVYLIYYF